MDRETIFLAGDSQRQYALSQIGKAPKDYVILIKPPTRTDDQNRKLWPMLKDISEQVEWHGQWLSSDEWKDVLTAGLKRHKVYKGIDGGFVTSGLSTSGMGKRLFAELIDLITAFGDQYEVNWSDPNLEDAL